MPPQQDLDVDHLTSLYIGSTASSPIVRAQLVHRIHVVKDIWSIPQGSKVLEIGPGQGDCTLVLAAAVGETGHVDAVDPCDLNYGSPTTVGDSQSNLLRTSLGPRISFIQAKPLDHLARHPSYTYTHIVLFHSLWYFDNPSDITALFENLVLDKDSPPVEFPRPRILIAEWSLTASMPSQVPHLLAALARNMLESRNPKSDENIRTAVSPAWIEAEFANLSQPLNLKHGIIVTTAEGLLDGQWEVGSVLDEDFEKKTERLFFRVDEKSHAAVISARDAVRAAVAMVEGGVAGCRAMDVWCAEFQEKGL